MAEEEFPKMEFEKEKRPVYRHCMAFAILTTIIAGFCCFAYTLLSPLGGFGGRDGHKSLTYILRKLESSSRIATFKENEDFKSLDHKYDGLWDDYLLPHNGGYITSSTERNNTDKLGISMFHQLHCLGMIRDDMQRMKDRLDSMKAGGHAEGEHAHDVQVHARRHMHGDGNPDDHEHALHCFDYLRQTLLCHADATIEKPKMFEDGKPYIDGGGERKCKNWELLYDASTESDGKPFFTEDLR